MDRPYYSGAIPGLFRVYSVIELASVTASDDSLSTPSRSATATGTRRRADTSCTPPRPVIRSTSVANRLDMPLAPREARDGLRRVAPRPRPKTRLVTFRENRTDTLPFAPGGEFRDQKQRSTPTTTSTHSCRNNVNLRHRNPRRQDLTHHGRGSRRASRRRVRAEAPRR